MTFDRDAVALFAAWSADSNPLHVDPEFARQTYFGEQVVHGLLTVFRSLTDAGGVMGGRRLTTLDIEFRNAVLIGRSYETRVSTTGADDVVVTLHSGAHTVLAIRGAFGPVAVPPATDTAWLATADHDVRTVPAIHDLEALSSGVTIAGRYPAPPVPAGLTCPPCVSATGARVLALCSYVTGMEVPGLKSLFTRITLAFHDDAEGVSELRYRAKTVRFDRQFRLLDTELTVGAPDGRIVATALLRAYVPFSPVPGSLDELAARLVPEARQLAGKVALVVGGSRGLGADIAAALGLTGAHVYVSGRREDDASVRLVRDVGAHGGQIEFLQGDAADPAWCRLALEHVQARHGGVDLVVLNACEPPAALRVAADTAAERERYTRENLRLVETPLSGFAAAVEARQGAFAFISSSFVEATPPGFSHYVALKQAGEALLRTVVRERPALSAVIARPPVLQTRWNDTPSGVIGSIPADWAASHLINTLAQRGTPGHLELLTEFPAFAAAPPVADFTIRIAASFTTDPLLPAVRFWIEQSGLHAAVQFAPYGQLLQSLLDPSSAINGKGRGANVILVRVGDWLRELSDDHRADIERLREYLHRTTSDFEAAVRAHRAHASAETVLIVCPSYGAASSAESILLRQAEESIAATLSPVSGLVVSFAADHHAAYDVREDHVHDELRDHIAHIPFVDDYLYVLAAIALRHVYRRLAPVRKAVVVDCDNTLWRGVVGEVGAEGVEFDSGHRALHALLSRLSKSGVLIGLCSKNEEADVWRVFETRTDFGLRRDDVVAAMVNWLPKSQNLRTLAARLNLGLDSFVFLDDNPIECAEVRAGCPEVLTIQWPQEPDRAERLTNHLWELDAAKATKEDARRTELYKEEFRRQEARAETLTFESFIESLGLEVDFSVLTPEDVRRSAQLTLRTNQFNFTTIRREEADVEKLASGGAHEIRTVRVRDRFGDYGLVGLLIAERGTDVWSLDTFLLSCRVLGRGVEHRILADLGKMAASAGARAVRMRVDATKRNTPARSFFEAVVPAEHRHGDASRVEAEIPSESLAAVRFEPSVSGEVVIEDDSAAKGQAKPIGGTKLRQREEQIVRAAFELNSGPAMRAAANGRSASAIVRADVSDVEDVVRRAFAAALRLTVETVARVDGLEALGCDSLRIVEITVALSGQFPWLPSTLLFEHRSVSQIVREIVRLSAPVDAAPAAAVTRHDTPSGAAATGTRDIAIVGIGLRCAGANSPAELWSLLSAGRSGVVPVPADRPYFLRPLLDTRSHWAGLLDGVGRFDPEFFGVSPREAEVMDPQLRLFLEVAWSALEDAGLTQGAHEPGTGVFAGVMYSDYGFRANANPNASGSPYRCWEGFSLANRLSQLLDFHGPSLAVDTACSSSATAIHLACSALTAGECTVAIAGGVNLILDPDRFASLGRLGILSARGQCEPFGADADGTVLGEGAGVVVLRPLAEAVRRGDRVYGVIKGSGLSTGSGTVGFTAPNPQAQAEAIRRSLRAAAIDPRTVTYVETHGTGTLLGDPIEVRGLALAYGDPALRQSGIDVDHRCAIGSIKPNVGHLEAGAGVLGLIKIVLQFQHRTRVPSLTSAVPSPHIPFAQGPFGVQRALEHWEPVTARVGGRDETIPRRAGLNSFGVGGANVHLIVEEPPAPPVPDAVRQDRPAHVLALSAVSEAALQRQVEHLQSRLTDEPAAIADLCYSINTGRKRLARRLAVVASNRGELLESLRAAGRGRPAVAPTPSDPPKVAWLFTGQGSQYAGMGRAFYDAHPIFRQALDRCADVLDQLVDRPLRKVLFAPEGSADAQLLDQTGYTQPALFALQYALAQMWLSWGVKPDVVMGHSVGEIAAICVAGGVSLEDALSLIAARGRLMQALPPGGVMSSVMADEDRVLAAIGAARESVAIAAVNAPGQVVISGPATDVAEVSARLGADGIRTKALTVSHAFHSPLMKPMLIEYEAVVRRIRFSPLHIPLVSCVDGDRAPAHVTEPGYWLRQVMEPVRFADGMRTIEQFGTTAYVEIGPHPVLINLGRRCVADEAQAAWLPSLDRAADPWRTVLDSTARLFERGGDVDWGGFDAPFHRSRLSVPGYAFAEREFWLKDPASVQEPYRATLVKSVDAVPPRAADCYEIAWEPQPAPPLEGLTGEHLLVFADRGGVGAALATVLEANGATVALVEPGDGFEAAPGRYRIDPAEPEHYERLWAEVASVAPAPRVVHLWSLDAPPNDALDADALDAWSRAGIMSVVSLARVAARGLSSGRSLWVVTRGAVATAAGAGIEVAQAAVWGLGRTISLELPGIWGGLIDVPAGKAAAQLLGRELSAGFAEDQVALRDQGRFVARLSRLSLPAREALVFAADGAYVVTGGLGALGLRMAAWLVERGARHIVLASRRAAEGARPAAIASLEAQGATVTVLSADVSRKADVVRLVAAATSGSRRLRGVIHAAGVDVPAALATLDPVMLQEALAAKGTGAWLLHQATREADLDFFVCFSSLAGVLGSQGRAHYAAANALLDALAVERQRLGLPATSVSWGPWRGGGMATDQHLEQFERIGNRGLEPEVALRTLDIAIASGRPHVVVADIDWDVFQPAYEARRQRPVISGVTRGDRRPAAQDLAPWVASVAGVSPDAREVHLAGLIRREVAETMGFDDPESVPPDRDFYELGVDSLMMADLVGRLRKQVGFSCNTLVFEHPNVRALASRLLPRLPAPDGRAPGTASAPPVEFNPGQVAGAANVYTPAVDDELMAFQRQAFPTRQPELVVPRWQWMFAESARRLGLPTRFWFHREDGAIVGQMGLIPVRLAVRKSCYSTGWLVETMVLDNYRDRAIGSRLMVQAHDDQPFSLSLGQTAEMRDIQFRLGWRQVAPLQIAQRLVRPGNVLSGKLPKPAAWAAGLGLKASTFVRDWMDEPVRLEVRPVAQFGERHDRLWSEAARDLECAVVRDASYLNWKYVTQPGQTFVRQEIVDGDKVMGVAVWMVRAPDGQYRYRRAFLVDLVTRLGDSVALVQVIKAACAAIAGEGVDALLCHHISPRLTHALKAAGFHLREPERFLLVDAEGLPDDVRDTVLSPDAWFVTQGDSDVDRPW